VIVQRLTADGALDAPFTVLAPEGNNTAVKYVCFLRIWKCQFTDSLRLITGVNFTCGGALCVETLERLTVPPALRAGILTGFIGGYTTFSTFEWEIFALGRSAPPMALIYGVSSVLVGWVACWAGASIARRA